MILALSLWQWCFIDGRNMERGGKNNIRGRWNNPDE